MFWCHTALSYTYMSKCPCISLAFGLWVDLCGLVIICFIILRLFRLLPVFCVARSLWISLSHRMWRSRPASGMRTLLNCTVPSYGVILFISSWKQARGVLFWKSWRAVGPWENLKLFGWRSTFSRDSVSCTPKKWYTMILNVSSGVMGLTRLETDVLTQRHSVAGSQPPANTTHFPFLCPWRSW